MGERLGQHFLKNKSIAAKTIEALNLRAGETVIEIGPGEGALTLPLAEACRKIGCKIIAIETDHELVNKLESLKVEGLEIVEGDALKVLPDAITRYSLLTTNYKLVGNIPYYITGQILRTIGDLEKKPAISVLMVQKEVAERVSANPPKMNLLAAAVQIWAEASIIARLKPKDFDPPPKVDSAVIKLVTKNDSLIANNQSLVASYYRLIKLIFKQPRKTALNNLSDGLAIDKTKALELMKSIGLIGTERPQNFSLDQLLKLSRLIP